MNVAIIGSGNVAVHFSQALKRAGYTVVQIFSRTEENARHLAEKLNCPYAVNIADVSKNADIYLFAVRDDALRDVISHMPVASGIWIHTAGSVPLDVFGGFTERCGVIYPLQTFSKERELNFRKVPLFIEAGDAATRRAIEEMAAALSENVIPADSETRKRLHLAAVFACNFTNHLYAIASDMVEKQGIDRKVLQPLIDETADKIRVLAPHGAQTGPAVRSDSEVMEKHLKMIDSDTVRNIYGLMSENIKQYRDDKLRFKKNQGIHV